MEAKRGDLIVSERYHSHYSTEACKLVEYASFELGRVTHIKRDGTVVAYCSAQGIDRHSRSVQFRAHIVPAARLRVPVASIMEASERIALETMEEARDFVRQYLAA